MKYFLLFFAFFISSVILPQPVINGNMSDASYTTLASFTSGRNGFGNDNDMGVIKYYSNGTDLYIGITGETVVNDNLILFIDFSGYEGRGSNTLTAGGIGVFQNIGGAKMDFDVDFALAFNKGNTNDKFYLDACRYGTAGVIACTNIGNTTSQLGVSVTENLGATFGGAGDITYAFNNDFPNNTDLGIEMKIPIAAFAGVTNSQAFRVFAVFTNAAGFFSNECIPGDPGADNPGNNADFSVIAGQKFYTEYAPLVFGITFDCKLDAGPSSGPWMGDMHPGENPQTPFAHHFQNPQCMLNTCGAPFYDCGYYAYSTLTWNPNGAVYNNMNCCPPYNNMGSGQTSYANAVVENTDLIDGVSNVTITFETFTLSNVNRLNWGGAAAGPNGLMGDIRTYTGGIGYLKVDGVTKLTVTDNFIELTIDYPTPYGKGDNIVGVGQGTIDVGNSDPVWAAKFNNGNGQIQYDYYSFSPTVQNCYGAFTYTVILRTAEVQQNVGAAVVPGNQLIPIPIAKVNFNISANSGNTKYVHARQIMKQPAGTLPDGIVGITPFYWRLGTTLDAITTQVIFDISGVENLSNRNNLKILKRENAGSAWAILGDFTLPNNGGLTNDQVRANNITSFSEFVIASTSDPLPVEFQTFDASVLDGRVTLNWTTATEIDNYGFEIMRRSKQISPSLKYGEWVKIGFVKGNGNSNSEKQYLYKDEINVAGRYEYQLVQIDNDGTQMLSKLVEIVLNAPVRYELSQNYPNPFNPSTKIKYSIPVSSEGSPVILKIFDVIGNEVTTLVNEPKEAGVYEVNFDGKNISSGVYFYKLQAGNYTAVKKMSLVK